METINLNTKVSQLNRVGKTLSSRLGRLGIETVRDLIFYYPFRYDDFSQTTQVDQLQSGMSVTIVGKVELIASRRSRAKRKMMTEGLISDDSGSVKVIWFNQPWITKSIAIGDEISLSGKVAGDGFNIYLNSPSYEKTTSSGVNTGRITPVYSLTDGITQKQLRFLINSVIHLASDIVDFLPDWIIREEKLYSLAKALKEIHFPDSQDEADGAKQRLAFDELFLIQLWSQIIKKDIAGQDAVGVKFFEKETKELVDSLPFTLTGDQKKSAWEIIRDLQKNSPMNRLMEGDVGSGKTVVAVLAMYNVFLNKYQSILMAPTEILARQHFDSIRVLLNKKSVQVGLLTRTQRFIDDKKVTKKEFLLECKNGDIDVLIGTHALIQEAVEFKKIGLVVVDEQHRFGVGQRQLLRQKSKQKKVPHFLSMTATPIPRSLALTLYGDLDLSIIREMPLGRKEIITRAVLAERRQDAYEFIKGQIKSGRQVFVICPLIDPSDKLGVRSVTEEFEKLDKDIFPDLKIRLLHGRLKGKEKADIMDDFVANKINILVATSVVEVGVDIPNATIMMIEGSERFGLSQLHQFRGRVGRGEHQSYCFLFSDDRDPNSVARLRSLVECNDGFELANRDLELRGAGSVYGREQSGFETAHLRLANITNVEQVKKARDIASRFMSQNTLSDYPLLAEKIKDMGFVAHPE